MNISEVVRIENKYLIGTNKKLELISKLKQILEEDSFGKQGYYSIRSVYFDRKDFNDYLAKVKEVTVKKGIRLRIYGPYDEKAKLELKFKNNGIQEKLSLKIEKEDALELLKCNYEVLKKYKTDIAKMFYFFMVEGEYRPVTTIIYDRKAFNCKKTKTRVTIDSNLQYSNENFDIWNEELTLNYLTGINEHILEVKINPKDEKNEINRIIFPLEIEELPNSKYRRCCKFLTK